MVAPEVASAMDTIEAPPCADAVVMVGVAAGVVGGGGLPPVEPELLPPPPHAHSMEPVKRRIVSIDLPAGIAPFLSRRRNTLTSRRPPSKHGFAASSMAADTFIRAAACYGIPARRAPGCWRSGVLRQMLPKRLHQARASRPLHRLLQRFPVALAQSSLGQRLDGIGGIALFRFN